MSRYIDAEAVKNPYGGTSLEWQGILLLKLLDDAPSIDIVRCKECKYYHQLYGCQKNDDIDLVTDDDDFCSYGEREGE